MRRRVRRWILRRSIGFEGWKVGIGAVGWACKQTMDGERPHEQHKSSGRAFRFA